MWCGRTPTAMWWWMITAGSASFALKDRHTAVEVNYTDPQNGWQTSTELVEDPEAILRYGRNLLKMDAFGCTSRGQAHRAGLWVIKTDHGNADGGFHARVTGAASHTR